MCRLVIHAIQRGGEFLFVHFTLIIVDIRMSNDHKIFCYSTDEQVLSDVRKIVCDSSYTPTNSKELCNRIFHTCYMGSENSSAETKQRAEKLASEIGRFVASFSRVIPIH